MNGPKWTKWNNDHLDEYLDEYDGNEEAALFNLGWDNPYDPDE